MGALALPQLEEGPHRDLVELLHALHRRAGHPSLRDLGQQTGVRRTELAAIFSGVVPPEWEVLLPLVEALDGDVGEFRRLVEEQTAAATTTAPESPAWDPATGVPGPRHRAPRPVDAAPEVVIPPGWRDQERLPSPPRPFVGREGERAVLDTVRLVPNPTGQSVVLVSGPAGVGKSAVVAQWVRHHHGSEPTLYVDLAGSALDGPIEPYDALGALLTHVGVRDTAVPSDHEAREALWRSCVAGHPLVLVLDDVASSEQVRGLVPATTACIVVVTSRHGLPALVREYGALRLELSPLTQAQAVKLLDRILGDRSRQDPKSAAAIAEHCGGYPGALRLVAEHAKLRPRQSLAGLVAELDLAVDRLDPDSSAGSTPWTEPGWEDGDSHFRDRPAGGSVERIARAVGLLRREHAARRRRDAVG